jgi:hypothetical protein
LAGRRTSTNPRLSRNDRRRPSSHLAAAASNIPKIFWIILLLFGAAVSFLSGRDAPKRFPLQVILIHMAAIGLGVGLVVVLNNPFRGQTKIDPAIIRDALRPLRV